MDAFIHSSPQESAYTDTQASTWLKRLSLPSSHRSHIALPTSFPKTISSLTMLLRCQITTFPYENLSVHYSPTHIVDIRPDAIYEKLLGASPPTEDETGSRGRGGYCMEVSIFFHHMLRALGFWVYMTGIRNRSRINGVPQGEFQGWTHINNVVHLPSGRKYSLDVGFGGDGPTSPLPMDGLGTAIPNLGAQQVRLVHEHIPKQRLCEPKPWIYQYRNSADREWNSFYCFQEIEFFQEDFAVQNLWTSMRPPHRRCVMVVRFLRENEPVTFPTDDSWRQGEQTSDAEVKIAGKVMLVDTVVKVNTGGRTYVVHEFDTENGRCEALHHYFGITLTHEEKASIKSWDMALK